MAILYEKPLTFTVVSALNTSTAQPINDGTATNLLLGVDGSNTLYINGTAVGVGGSGTVTSVAVTVPSFMAVSGSPITSSGTLALSFSNKNPNLILAGPVSGGAATPAFRALVAADLGSGTANTTTFLRGDLSWQAAGGGGSAPSVVTKTSNYVAVENQIVLVDSTGGNVTITLPAAASTTLPVTVKKISADGNNIVVVPPSGTVDGLANFTSSTTLLSHVFISDATNYWIV